MFKNSAWFYKILAVGFIFLFIGIGFQPVIATVEFKTSNRDDCDLCPKNKNVDQEKVETLINRLEAVTSSTLLRYGHISEVREKCEKVLEFVNSPHFLVELCLDFAYFIWQIALIQGPILVVAFIYLPIVLILGLIWSFTCGILLF